MLTDLDILLPINYLEFFLKSIPAQVLKAFGVHEDVKALEGGQGEAFRAGDRVLKPAVEGAEWIAETIDRLPEGEIRLSRPIQTGDGKWVQDGWCAWKFIPGHTDEKRVAEILAAGKEFNNVLKGVPRPDFLDRRMDPWAVADRMAWGEIPLRCHPRLMELLNELQRWVRPLDLPRQVIHADLLGNILFEEGLPPGIIDFSPFWPPADYALAIAVADALDWHGAKESALQPTADIPKFFQLLVRAEIFRLAVYEGFHLEDKEVEIRAKAHQRTIELIKKYGLK